MPPQRKSKTASFKVDDSQSEAEQNVDELEKDQTGEVEESDGETSIVAPEHKVENLDVISISEQACSSHHVESSSQTSVNKSSSLAQEMQENPIQFVPAGKHPRLPKFAVLVGVLPQIFHI